MAKKQKEPFFLGDREFSKKMVKVYDWIMTVVFGAMAILMLISKAWLTTLIFLFGAIVMIPQVKKSLEKYHFKSLARFVFCALIIIIALYSTGLYAK